MQGFSRSLWIIVIIGVLLIAFLIWKPWARKEASQPQNSPTREAPSGKSPTLEDKPSIGTNAPKRDETTQPPANPRYDLPFGGRGQVIDNGCYVISYLEQYEQPEWTEYVLDGRPLMKIKRENDKFVEDPLVVTGSAVPADYRNSGYDRGHLVPAADMKSSMDCFTKSFLLSNISPQAHDFNTGIWRRLEESVRRWSRKKYPLQVISGPILNPELKRSIGKENKIPVPEEYFKVIVYHGLKGPQAIGFIMPNEDSDLSIERYAVSVAQVERRTGFDFDRSLPDDQERILENTLNLKDWF